MLPKADIVKVSEEELELISGEADEDSALQQMQKYNIPVLIITKGELGSTLIVGKEKWDVPVEKVDAVDTTGAGDAYVSGLLSAIIEKGQPIQHLSKEEWMDIARAASVSGGLAASVKGAMAALPLREDVNRLK
nr:PfkB family carbohydrate kinase [Sinobaca sp. H24]